MKQLFKIPAIATVMVSLVFAVACTKKRDAALPYGADRDLLTISNYEDQEYDLQTQDLLKPANTGAKYKIEDARKGSKSEVQNFDYVNYKANDPLKLTDDTLMLGRPNHLYKMKYKFEGNVLKVMKISAPKDLSSDERAVAIEAGNGRLMVPIVSYSVSYFTTDVARNERNEKTSRLELLPQNSPSSATHFKIEPNSKTRASFLSKTTVLPADFFDGADGDSKDWYFSYTIINTNYKDSMRDGFGIGDHAGSDKYGRSAQKVRVKKLEDKIIFYNLAVDNRMEKTIDVRSENQAAVITLPADFIDYRFSESGKSTSVKEETHQERAWDKRAYVDIKLKEVKLAIGAPEISEIKDVQIDDGYLSFSVVSDSFGGVVRFSFLNVKAYQQAMAKQGAQPYKTKIYFPQDEKLFGYMSSQRESLSTFDRSKKQIDDLKTMVNRFNPTRKSIEYRLNHDAPEWTEELVKKAAAGWNATFKAAGVGTRIHVTDENGKVLRGNMGDLRYSMINMFHEIDGAGSWYGFGPALADPHTGEIIMATTSMNLNNIIEEMEQILNSYILSKKGALDKKYVIGLPLPSLQAIVNAAERTVRLVGEGLGFVPDKNLVVYDAVTRTYRKDYKTISERPKIKMNFSNQKFFESSFNVINGNISSQIEEVCPEMKNYAESLKDNQAKGDLDKELALVKECALALSKPRILTTLLHEIGHNLGLRHNFYGSVDSRNFYAPVKVVMGGKTVETKWYSSTVMDYLQFDYKSMTQPGRYDIAAIRWGYADQVEVPDGSDGRKIKVVSVNPTMPTMSQMKGKMVPYMYCTDEDTDVVVRDPLCARHDKGLTADEAALDLVNQYDAYIALSNNRHDRARVTDMVNLGMIRKQAILMPMKRIYEQWRNILAAHVGPGKEYLESFQDIQSYQKLLADVVDPAKVGPEQAKRNAEYKKASDIIFSFLMRMTFLPDYSCIAGREINENQTLQMFSFSKIQKNIYNSTGTTVTSCQDPEVATYLQQKKQANVVAEAGYAFENLYADLSEKRVSLQTYQPLDTPEVTGLAMDRFYALTTLVERTNELYTTQANQFAPNFVDEPIYRAILNDRILSRLTKGVAIQETGLTKVGDQELPELISPSFEAEKPLLGVMFPMLKEGLVLPQKPVVNNQRMEKYAIVPMYYLNGTEDYECVMIDGYSYCATEQHSESKKLVKQLKQLENLKAALKISEKSVETFLGLAKAMLPEKGKGAQLDIAFLDALFEKLGTYQESDPSLYQEMILLTNVFGEEMSIWQQGIAKKLKKINEDDISAKEAESRIAALKKIKIKDLVEKLGIQGPEGKAYEILDQEIFEKRVREYSARLKMQATAYEADPTELDAQADLILNALIGR